MSKGAKKVLDWVGGILVVAALTFGLMTATARSAVALDCANDGYWFLGSKPSYQACEDACVAIHGPDIVAVWNPTTTCCKCML
jgi:hypothetical protein